MAKGTTVRMWRRTIAVLAAMILLGFGAVVVSLFKLQVVQGEELKTKAVDQQLRDDNITAKRGTIYDSNMKVMAQSATVWKVILDPNTVRKAKNSEEMSAALVEGLSEALDMDKADIEKALEKKTYSYVLKRQVDMDVKDKVLAFKENVYKEKKIKIGNAVLLQSDFKRYYPGNSTASVVLGFTGSDNQGLAGLEAQYDTQLTGTAGKLVVAKNAVGTDMPFQYEQEVDAHDGNSLVLTIDSTIQRFAEKYLEIGVEKFKPKKRAGVVIMDVKTGGILAMAIKGDFDPNQPFAITDEAAAAAVEALSGDDKTKAKNEALQQQWRNKLISDTYYPGSVFKTITGSSALEEGVITMDTPFECKGGRKVGGRTIRCWKLHPGVQNFAQAVCHSCNPAFIDIGQKLGPDNFFKYFKAYGFTEKTGIDLPGETKTVAGVNYYTADKLNPVELATESFGQNFGATPIQMLTAFCAVVNGGNLVQPHVVDKIVDSDGNIVKSMDTMIKRQVISKEVSENMCKILQENVISGGGKTAYLPGYRVGAKTGTSQKIDVQVATGEMQYISSFCGFAPADDPQIAMLVYYDEPDKSVGFYGSQVAGPTFVSVMKDTLDYLGVEPKYTEAELEKLDVKTPNLKGLDLDQAKAELSKKKLKYTVLGSGDTVVKQVPENGKSIPQGGTVVLYTEDSSQGKMVKVPKLTGLTPAAANKAAVNAGLNISVTGAALTGGSSLSSTQDIPEGTEVPAGTVVTVSFSDTEDHSVT